MIPLRRISSSIITSLSKPKKPPSQRVPGRLSGVVCGAYGCWRMGLGPAGGRVPNVRYHEGTFVIDLALRNPKKLAYRAISQKELNNKQTITPYQAEEAVNHLLKGLKVK